MTEKKEFQVNKNTPFWDASLTDQERIDWLLKEMTVEEKLGYLASSSPDLPRLASRESLWAVRRHTALRQKRSERSWKTGCDNILPAADRYECILGPGADQAGR